LRNSLPSVIAVLAAMTDFLFSDKIIFISLLKNITFQNPHSDNQGISLTPNNFPSQKIITYLCTVLGALQTKLIL